MLTDIDQQNKILQQKLDELTQENNKLKQHISSLQELLGSQICKYFELSNSLRDTKKRFCYENVRECYGDLVYFYGCTDPIQRADDYEECYREIFNRDYPRDTDDDNSESSD